MTPLEIDQVRELGRQALIAERERCIAEVRRVQKRNTATVEAHDAGKPHTWNMAVKTMADECADAIATLADEDDQVYADIEAAIDADRG